MNAASLDIALLTWVHDHAVPGSTPVWQFISNYTTFTSISLGLIVLIIAVVRKSKPMRIRVLMIALVLITVPLLSQGLKLVIDRERPFITYPYIEKLSSGGDSSFPSGHTLEAFAMAAVLSVLFRKKRIIIPVYIWAIAVGYSRMALGVHYPSDILAGILIGTLIGWGIPWIFNRAGFTG